MPSKECKHPTCSGDHCRRPKPEKKVYQLKRTPLKRSSKPIKKVAEKRKYSLTQYYADRAVFLKSRPLCEVGLSCCKKKATEIHHAAGRENHLLNLQAYWVPICRPCHTWITEHSKEAIEMGFSVRRII